MLPLEHQARQTVQVLDASGWQVQDHARLNLSAARGITIREFPPPTDLADYLLFVDPRAIGAAQARAAGATLAGVEAQSAKYIVGLPDIPPARRKPLPFLHESSGVGKFFTNGIAHDLRTDWSQRMLLVEENMGTDCALSSPGWHSGLLGEVIGDRCHGSTLRH